MRTFFTNAVCPKCGNFLETSDVEGYGFVCKECNENFYSLETKTPFADFFEINVKITVDKYKKIEEKLKKLVEKYNCYFLGFDDFFNQVDIGWEYIPDANVINLFTEELKNIIESLKEDKELYRLVFYKKSGKDIGSQGHEEFFESKEELDTRCREVFNKKSNFNPTAWVKTKKGYERLLGY